MWRTPKEIRVVKGPESALFRETIGTMIDELTSERDCEEIEGMQTTYRVSAFDDLPMMQRLGLLRDVSHALLRKDAPPLKLTAVNEATLAAIINNVEQLIWCEIDDEDISVAEVPRDKYYWRALLLACNHTEDSDLKHGESDDDKTEVESVAKDDWEIEIQSLADRFLWDIDFEYTDIPDMPPEQAEAERRAIGIEQDYYDTLPPDPHEDEFDSLVGQIRVLCNTTT